MINLFEPFKSYLRKYAAYNFVGSMINESKFCSDAIKNYFNTKPLMPKNNNEKFENSTKC